MRVQDECTLTPDAKKGNPKAAPIPSPPSTSLQRPPVFNQRGAQQAVEIVHLVNDGEPVTGRVLNDRLLARVNALPDEQRTIPAGAVPPGGLSMRRFRSVRFGDLQRQIRSRLNQEDVAYYLPR